MASASHYNLCEIGRPSAMRPPPARAPRIRKNLPKPRSAGAWPHNHLVRNIDYRLVTIHPFVEGNERAARLLMNLLVLMRGYPPAIIRTRDQLAYIGALERAQLGGARSDFDTLAAKAAERSLDIYLAAARGESTEAEADAANLMKIGALAKAVGVTIATIRFWTAEKRLEVADVTASGYQLYSPDMIARCELIRRLKEQRLTSTEIKTRLG